MGVSHHTFECLGHKTRQPIHLDLYKMVYQAGTPPAHVALQKKVEAQLLLSPI